MTVDQQPVEVAREFVTASHIGDWERVRDLAGEEFVAGEADIHADIELLLDSLDGFDAVAPVFAEQFRPAQVEDDLSEFIDSRQDRFETFAPEDIRFENVTVEPDGWVVYHLCKTERHVGMYYGLEPSGESFSYDLLGVIRVVDGRVREIRMIWNRVDAFDQLGILPGSGNEFKVTEQFDAVVSRVLRHNLRNSLTTVLGHVELLADGNEHAEAIQVTSKELLATAEKVRTLEQRLFDQRDRQSVELGAIVGGVVETVRTQHPAADIEMPTLDEELTVPAQRPVLELVLKETLENAVVHADTPEPWVELAVIPVTETDKADTITITISDDGPGIPDHELAPLMHEREDPLVHGSGVGLWAIKWGIEQLGGDVEFDANDTNGTVVRLHLPAKN